MSELLIPVAQQRYAGVLQDWDAIDTKALGVLAAGIAALAALAAFHDGVNHLWWIPALGLFAACVFLALVIRTYPSRALPDLFDLHDQMRDEGRLETARELLEGLTDAADENDGPVGTKVRLFGWGMIVLALSLAGCFPVLLVRPH